MTIHRLVKEILAENPDLETPIAVALKRLVEQSEIEDPYKELVDKINSASVWVYVHPYHWFSMNPVLREQIESNFITVSLFGMFILEDPEVIMEWLRENGHFYGEVLIIFGGSGNWQIHTYPVFRKGFVDYLDDSAFEDRRKWYEEKEFLGIVGGVSPVFEISGYNINKEGGDK